MKNNKAISMVSLVVTIVLIIILASISGAYFMNVIKDAQIKDVREEIKNIETVVEYAKSQILIGEFVPDEANKISNADLESKFKTVLTAEEIDHIERVNNTDSIDAPYKYYLMTQEKFDQEFGNDFNVSNLKPYREYLVNYMDTYIMVNYSDQKIANLDNLIPSGGISGDSGYGDAPRGEIKVTFYPNGNSEWKQAQATDISITKNDSVVIEKKLYLWTQSYTQPTPDEFGTNQIEGDGEVVKRNVQLNNETGSDWFVWVYIEYQENGIPKTYATRSNAFYIDNTPPTGSLTATNVNR